MEPRTILRLEGLAILCVALAGYGISDGPIWLLALLALAPDLSMLGYLAGPRVGSQSYNLAHTYVLPLLLGTFGYWMGVHTALLVSLIWAGHIGADRLLGYGLKYESGFKETHLSGRPFPATEAPETDR